MPYILFQKNIFLCFVQFFGVFRSKVVHIFPPNISPVCPLMKGHGSKSSTSANTASLTHPRCRIPNLLTIRPHAERLCPGKIRHGGRLKNGDDLASVRNGNGFVLSQCVQNSFLLAAKRAQNYFHSRSFFCSVFNRIKRAAFVVRAYVVMREACTFRFDAAEPLSNNRLEEEILYIMMCTPRSRRRAKCRRRRHPDKRNMQGWRSAFAQ